MKEFNPKWIWTWPKWSFRIFRSHTRSNTHFLLLKIPESVLLTYEYVIYIQQGKHKEKISVYFISGVKLNARKNSVVELVKFRKLFWHWWKSWTIFEYAQEMDLWFYSFPGSSFSVSLHKRAIWIHVTLFRFLYRKLNKKKSNINIFIISIQLIFVVNIFQAEWINYLYMWLCHLSRARTLW